MRLAYFSEDAYARLKASIEFNRFKYSENKDWVSAFFIEEGISNPIVKSGVEISDVELVYTGKGIKEKNQDDLGNAINLYQSAKNLPENVATNYHLWTALCHDAFYEYVQKRWGLETPDDNSKSTTIGERFFATTSRKSLYYGNAVARLWWSAYLTYDEKNTSDPFYYTKILFKAQQTQKDLFDQPFSMNRVVTKGMLSALEPIQQKKGNNAVKPFRECCTHFINRYGAVSILDSLTEDEIKNIAYNYMDKWVPEKEDTKK